MTTSYRTATLSDTLHVACLVEELRLVEGYEYVDATDLPTWVTPAIVKQAARDGLLTIYRNEGGTYLR